MCGIVGFVDPAGATAEPQRVLVRMRDALTHRGPDQQGAVSVGPAHLGHRRLSIVDLTEAGRQPFDTVWRPGAASGSGRVLALANGEIYDHWRHRASLATRFPGAPIPASDCAVLPWLWRAHGDALAGMLSGMFALAVWDVDAETLWLARDPMGQKPLYWAPLPGGGLAFASEPKGLLLHPHVGREVDAVGLRGFLVHDFVPGERTIYRGVRKLRAGEQLIWRGEDRQARTSFHFQVPPRRDPKPASLPEAGERLWAALGRAVDARLMADVPLGVFLSGGLDSTAVTASLTGRREPRSVHTFSVGFTEGAFDESGVAERVAEHLGTTHRTERLGPDALPALVPELVGGLDEPFADASLVPTYALCRFAREHVTVALGGDGGDELLMGYPTFYAERVAGWLGRAPAGLRHALLHPLSRALGGGGGYLPAGFKARRFLGGLDLAGGRRHAAWVGGTHPGAHAEALAPGWFADAPDDAVFAEVDRLGHVFDAARPDADPLERLAWIYAGTYLADGVLQKVDRASMAHALEVRAPLLDRDVVQTALDLGVGVKLRGRETKRVLRREVGKRVPAPVAARPKRGFGMPVATWLRGPLAGWVDRVLDPVRVRRGGLLDPGWVSRLWAEHRSGRVSQHKALWSCLVLELWRTGRWGPDGGADGS